MGMNRSSEAKEKRRYPRVLINLPADLRTTDKLKIVSGLVRNLSEGGLLIQTFTDMPVGMKINIRVLFPKDFGIADINAAAEIVWKDGCLWEDWDGYEYGLKFAHMPNEDWLKLKPALCGRPNLEY